MTRVSTHPSIKILRTLLLTLLAFMLLAFASAQVRSTVLVTAQANGCERIYETEITHSNVTAIRVAQLKFGRKPFERTMRGEREKLAHTAELLVSRITCMQSPRAPPHSPRAPPVAA